MDIPSEGGHIPEADYERISLTNLVLDEKYENNGGRVLLKLHGMTGNITVTPVGNMYYLDVGDDLESFLDIKFSLSVYLKDKEGRSRPLLYDLYYDYTSNNLIIRNRSAVPVKIHPISDPKAKQLFPQKTRYLSPGTYGIIIYKSRVLDLRVLARVDILDTTRKLVRPGMPSTHGEKSLKRELLVLEGELNESPNTLVQQIRKVGHNMNNSSTLFLTTGIHDILSSQSGTSNPFLHKRKVLSTRDRSEVYLAQHSGINQEIIVKVLKVRRSRASADNRSSLIDYAEAWLREYNELIVSLYGSNARFLIFFKEFAPGYDLAIKGVWRNVTNNYFCGSEDNAFQVSIHIASALEYLYGRGLEHNDIKPGNILLSKERGTILCDFGISRQPGNVFTFGVTILYLRKLISLPDIGRGFVIVARNKMASCLAKEKISDRVASEGERASQKSIDHSSTTEENESIEWVLRSPV
ncbi:kinase-like domain-containing protein [Hyaloscypha sp. PMI_1271]|nr:kinase-like domain-containing protein [Hyaloscypha sp. PMI_1271]